MMGSLLPVRISFRALAKRPGLVLGVVTCLGLGLGVSVAMFGILDELLWDQPEGVREPESVHRLYATRVYPGAGPITSNVFSYPAFEDLQAAGIGPVAAFTRTDVVVEGGVRSAKRPAALASSSYFSLLGLRPALGRFFSPEEGRPDSGSRAVVLGYRLWQGRFGGDPAILGQEILIRGEAHRVIGVAPAAFVGVDLRPVDLWLPMSDISLLIGEGVDRSRGSQIVQVLVRPSPDAPPPLVADTLGRRYRAVHEAESPGSPDAGAQLSLWPLLSSRGPNPSSDTRVAAWSAALALLVLLVSIANVANLLVVRAMSRRRESAVRLSLGAGRGALLRDVLTEGVILTLGGVLAAVPVALGVVALIQRFLVPDLAGIGRIVDARILLFAGLLIAATALGCGLLAAVPVRRLHLSAALKSGPAAQTSHPTLRSGLLVGQVALAAVLLAGAGLFLRSLSNVRGLDLGLEPEHLLVATIDDGGEARPADATDAITRAARQRLENLPGVEGAAVTATPPFGTSYGIGISVPGIDELPQLATGGPYLSVVEPSYFDVVGLRLTEGRTFDPESAEPSVIVNQTLAELVWGDHGALGECVVVDDAETAPCSRVVGVVEDSRRQRLQEPPTLQLYVPLDQGPDWISDRALVLRTLGDPAKLVSSVRQEMLAVDSHLPYVDVQPLEETLSPQYRSWRLGASVFSLFAILAVMLTVAGLYGVTAYSVAQRRRELGVRLTLGAEPRGLVLLLVRQGMRPAALGLVLGLAGALVLARALREQLFGVSPWDPPTFVAVALVLLLATAAALWWSARRVRRLQPVEVMASE